MTESPKGTSTNANDQIWFNDDGDFSGDRARMLFEQYKLYVEGTYKANERRATSNTFLLTANTALVTVYGLIAGKETALGAATGPWRWIIPLAGLTLCFGWFGLIRTFRTSNIARYAVIREVECRLPARLFDLEWHHLAHGKKLSYVPLTRVELLVPVVFAAIYIGLMIITTARG